MANPIEFDQGDEVVGGVGEWLKSREFEQDVVLARREELFQQQLQTVHVDGALMLELIAAHCLEPADSVPHDVLHRDFMEILKIWRGLITRVVEVDEAEPLIGRVRALESEVSTRPARAASDRTTGGDREGTHYRKRRAKLTKFAVEYGTGVSKVGHSTIGS